MCEKKHNADESESELDERIWNLNPPVVSGVSGVGGTHRPTPNHGETTLSNELMVWLGASGHEKKAGGSGVSSAANAGGGSGPPDYPTPAVVKCPEEFIYDADLPPDVKFRFLGRRLNWFDDLYRHPDHGAGLKIVVLSEKPIIVPITSNNDLLAVINDRLRITVVMDGKPKGGRIPPADGGSMLKSEVFLQQFRPLDGVIEHPLYLESWQLTTSGYNQGSRGQRFFFAGDESLTSPEPDTIRQFLDVIQFKSEADRTNTVAAALTVLLRNHWPGGKPMFPVSANRSHAGKGTVVAFFSGHCTPEQVTYEKTDWAFQKSVVTAFQQRPNLGVLNIDNIRLDHKGDEIKSGFLERILHESEPLLASPGTKSPIRVHNHFVIAATANEGRFSEDLMNRSVPIRLEATGDLVKRKSPIGDPKKKFLPQNRDRIDAELRGMVEKWKVAGCPLDENAKHVSFSDWARTIGGILMVSGFKDFLANQNERRSEDDPLRRSLACLGANYSNYWFTASEWSSRVAKLGLTKQLIPVADRDTSDGRARGIGVVLSNHAGETLTTETDDESITLVLQKARRRFDGDEPATKYRFEVIERCSVPLDQVP